jgi:elongation factor Ts
MSTIAITAADVNKLRTITGAGMMDCKKALTEAEGDFEKAIDILRKKGQKVAANRSDRDAKEGYVIAKTAGNTAVVLSLNCETDFVAKNADFGTLATSFLDTALNNKAQSLEQVLALNMADGRSIQDHVTDAVGKIGEKIEISSYGLVTGESVVAYNHPGNRVATIVAFNKATDDNMAKDVAMQAAAMAPIALDKDDVTQDVLDRELEIAKDQVRAEGKPEEMVEKIAIGKVNKFYKESTLNNQEFIKDNKKTVAQYVQEGDKDRKIVAFKRIALG